MAVKSNMGCKVENSKSCTDEWMFRNYIQVLDLKFNMGWNMEEEFNPFLRNQQKNALLFVMEYHGELANE